MNIKKFIVITIFFFITSLFLFFNSNRVYSADGPVLKGEFKKDELLVKFKNQNYIDSLLSDLKVEKKTNITNGLYKVKIAANEDIEKVYKLLKANSNIDYVEPNYKVKIAAAPNDSYYSQQWALQKISASSGWDKTQGNSTTKIAIIDTGVDYNHEDLQSKIWVNSGEISGNGIDDDNNGYIDDYNGFDFFNGTLQNPSLPFNKDTNKWVNDSNAAIDDHAHGTCVAGIAGAISNNSVGVAGIDWNAKIVPLKVLGSDGSGYISDIVAAIQYAADNNIAVVNLSLISDSYSSSLESIVNYAYGKGVIIAAAAGNDDSSNVLYPAKFTNVLAVGASNSSDQKITPSMTGGVWGSNYGPELDVVAPGINLYTTDISGVGGYSNGNYLFDFRGTSGATPHVAGEAALLKAFFPSFSNSQIMSKIKSGADNIDSVNPSYSGLLGNGRINLEKTISFESSVSSSLNLSPASVIVGGSNTASVTIHNYSSSPITYKALGVAVRLNEPAWNPRDFTYDNNVTIDAGADYVFEKSKNFTELGNYRMWVAALDNTDHWLSLGSINSSIYQITPQASYPNLKISTSLSKSPNETPGLGQEITFNFSVKNNESIGVTLNKLGIANRLNEPSWNPRDFGYQNNVSINAGSTYDYSYTTYFTELGNYRSFIASKVGNYWYNIPADAGKTNQITYSVGYPNVKVSTSLISNPQNPFITQQAIISFTVINNTQSPVHLPALGVAVRLNEPSWNPRDIGYDNVTINSGSTYNYSKNIQWNEFGSYRAWVAYSIGGKWYYMSADSGKTSNINWSVNNYPNLKISTSLSKSPNETPGLGQEITFNFSVKNNESIGVTLNKLGIANRLNEPSWNPRDFGYQNNVSINAGSTYDYSYTTYFTELGNYRSFIASKVGNYWYNIPADAGKTNQITYSVGYPNVKVKIDSSDNEGSLKVNPGIPAAGGTATFTFKTYNASSSKVHIPILGVAVRLNEPAWNPRDVGYNNVVIDPSSYYSYSKDLNLSLSDVGKWRAWVAYSIGGKWYYMSADGSAVREINFDSYLETDSLDGIILPASSGKVGREQHLAFSCQEASATHYSTSGVPAWAQNGMAWQTSGGCGYGAWGSAPSVADERYYINMRWNYTDVNGQPIYTNKNWYYQKKVVVTNPVNGKKIIASIIEYGPSPSTNRVSGLSPEAMGSLSAVTDNNLNYKWLYNQSLNVLGPIN